MPPAYRSGPDTGRMCGAAGLFRCVPFQQGISQTFRHHARQLPQTVPVITFPSGKTLHICIEKTNVEPANGITIEEAFSNKNNSLFIVIENSASESLLTVKAGDAYPNSMLGDIVIELPAGVSAIQLQDLSRFEKADGSIDLDFADGFSGTIFAVAK